MTSELSLLTGPGQRLLDRLAGQELDPAATLRLAESLRSSYPPELVAAALTQQALRVRARAKFSRADAMLFTRVGLEQASAERTARHSAARYPPGGLLADLCCGIGGNLGALAAGRQVIAVDRDQTSIEFARHNAAVYGAADAVAVARADVTELDLVGPSRRPGRAGLTGVFIDPARRADGRRLRAGQSDPPLGFCLDLADRVPAVGIKAAPGLPRDLVLPGWELEFVAVGRGLKEALLWSPALATTRRRATVLTGGQAAGPSAHTLVTAPGPDVAVAPPGAFLLDPNPAVTRAGLVQELARELGAWQFDPMIAFLSADAPLRTPFARTLRILDSARWNEKRFARRLRELDFGAADIRRRGLAGDVEQIRRRLGTHRERTATIVITRNNEKPWGLICTALDEPASG